MVNQLQGCGQYMIIGSSKCCDYYWDGEKFNLVTTNDFNEIAKAAKLYIRKCDAFGLYWGWKQDSKEINQCRDLGISFIITFDLWTANVVKRASHFSIESGKIIFAKSGKVIKMAVDEKLIPAPYKVIQRIATIDGELVAEVTCRDYDDFASLPEAIEFNGKVLGKTGWSSDTQYACYKSRVLLGKIR